MTPLVFDYLKAHSFDELRAEHGVKASVHGSKVSLNYDQIDADPFDELANQCRGLVLHLGADGRPNRVLAWPLNRFFNHGQPGAAEVNLKTATVWEKLDGTLCIVYHDGERWCVATRSVPEADQPINGSTKTFRELFEEGWAGLELTSSRRFDGEADEFLNRGWTYMFELVGPENRVVVEYSETSLHLLGCRDDDGEERRISTAVPTFDMWRRPPHWPAWNFAGIEEIRSKANDVRRKPTEHEGFVLCDADFNRVKIKSAEYVALHRTVSSLVASDRNLMALVLMGTIDDALPLLPPDKAARAEQLRDGLSKLVAVHRSYTEVAMHRAEAAKRKAFVGAIREAGLMIPPMMACYDGGDIDTWFHQRGPNGEPGQRHIDSLIAEIDKGG